MAAMAGHARMAMPFGATDFALLAMWWVMMVGMMLPSAAPMILTFATINRRQRARGQPYVPTALFVAGYLLAWGGFSVAATVAQWGLERRPALADDWRRPARGWAACCSSCRRPLPADAAQTGLPASAARRSTSSSTTGGTAPRARCAWALAHGLYCLGCCWILMALLFAVGVMNLLWVAAIAAFVFAEKLLPGGVWIGRIGGGAMAAFGAWLLV